MATGWGLSSTPRDREPERTLADSQRSNGAPRAVTHADEHVSWTRTPPQSPRRRRVPEQMTPPSPPDFSPKDA